MKTTKNKKCIKKKNFLHRKFFFFLRKTIETYMGERKKNKNIMCKYTSYTGKYTLYTGIEKQRLFLLKNFFINIQTNVRSTRTRWR
jgi:hypothetical protein